MLSVTIIFTFLIIIIIIAYCPLPYGDDMKIEKPPGAATRVANDLTNFAGDR